MNICTGLASFRHQEVAFNGIDCPVCDALARIVELEELRARDERISLAAPDATVEVPRRLDDKLTCDDFLN